MNNIVPNLNFEGDILTDITSFTLAQNLFDGKDNITHFHTDSFDSAIQLILFYDKVHIIEPFTYGGFFEINTPEILNELIQKKIVNQIPHEKYNLLHIPSHFYDITKMISPDKSFHEFAQKNNEVMSHLLHYQNNFNYVRDEHVNTMASSWYGLNMRLIPLVVNLFRFKSSISYIERIKTEQNKLFMLSPSITRIPLVKSLIKYSELEFEYRSKKTLNDLLKGMRGIRDKDLEKKNKRFGKKKKHEFKMPVLSTWILSQCTKKDQVLDKILEIRKDGKVRNFRNWTKNLQAEILKSDNTEDPSTENKFNDILEDFENDFKTPSSKKDATDSLIDNIPLSATELARLFFHQANEYGSRKDVDFLFQLGYDTKNVFRSKEPYERIFKVDLKNYMPEDFNKQ